MRIVVRAPATVANLGPGFDCFALAVDLRNEFVVGPGEGRGVRIRGEGAGELPTDGSNRVLAAMSAVASELGRDLPEFSLSCTNAIPLERGLGSSATAVVAGLLLADRLLGAGLGRERLLQLAAGLEGHPDNVTACLVGGLTLAYRSGEGWSVHGLVPHPGLRPVLLVPEAERIGTDRARRALPSSVAMADAVFNLARSALLVAALTERPDLLTDALEDRLHQPHRFALMPAVRSRFRELRRAGIPVCLAGSGPSLLAFEPGERRVPDPGPGWRVLRPSVTSAGAMVEEGVPEPGESD